MVATAVPIVHQREGIPVKVAFLILVLKTWDRCGR
jgi:hypothetical protein